MNKEQLNELENEIKEDFLIREKKVEICSKIEITKKRQEFNDSLRTKSMTDENNFFEKDIKPKYLNNINNIDYSIKIKGNLNPVNFMNFFVTKYLKSLVFINIFLDIDKNKLKFNVTFDVGEKLKDEIPEEIKKELKKLEINDENKEEKEEEEKEEIPKELQEELAKLGLEDGEENDDDFEKKDCIIQVKLFESINGGYLLRFMKKSGELEDYYKNLKNVMSLTKEIL